MPGLEVAEAKPFEDHVVLEGLPLEQSSEMQGLVDLARFLSISIVYDVLGMGQ